MTSREFIQRQFGNADGKEKSLSSIWKDGDGNIYSYGRHYPLLFTVDGISFRNCTGYSNSTAKHISWAGGFGATDIWVSGCNQYSWGNSENGAKIPHLLYLAHYGMTPEIKKALKKAVLSDLESERADIQERIDSKKRTDTKVFEALTAEYKDCVMRLNHVQNAWGLI